MINKYFLAKMNIPAYLKKFLYILYNRYVYTEIEGIPPIIFKGNGKKLLDYRIYGAIGGVGDLITDTSDENYGKYKVPVVVSGKNLLNNVSSTVTFQGVKFTINEDKSITLDGTASNNAWLTLQSNNVLDVGQYILTGAVNNTILRYQKNSTGYAYDDTGAGRNINITQKTTSGIISLKIKENVFYDNITIYPMIRLASIEDDTYEPYIEPTTTNIYLDEPIEANESISLSDTNTNIPTIRGTNVLTVDTTVQPSNVYIKVGGG